jgi:translation initiation factor IF-3
LQHVLEKVQDLAKLERQPLLEGRRLVAMLAPKS